MFSTRQNSHIIFESDEEALTAFSILMWVRPAKTVHGTVLVSKTKI